MPHPRRTWSVDDLAVLHQYPKKTLKQLAKELHCAISTARKGLLELGKEMHARGRGARDIRPDPVVTESVPPTIAAE